jgi:hypothetical protein
MSLIEASSSFFFFFYVCLGFFFWSLYTNSKGRDSVRSPSLKVSRQGYMVICQYFASVGHTFKFFDFLPLEIETFRNFTQEYSGVLDL